MTSAGPAEFSRSIGVTDLPEEGMRVTLEAAEAELQALAVRYNVRAVKSLCAEVIVIPWDGGVLCEGRFDARVEQECVVSLEPVLANLSEGFHRLFLPESEVQDLHKTHSEREIVVDSLEDDPPDRFDGHHLDLGEIVAEHVALALDPYPRKEGEVLESSTTESEAERKKDNPFNVLKTLKISGGDEN